MPYNTKEKQKAFNTEYYSKNRETFLARNKTNRKRINEQRMLHRKNNPTWQIYRSAKARARKIGIDFSIEESHIFIPEFCPALGIKLIPNIGNGGGASDASPTLDRIDNNKGYVVGNIHVISYKANRMKTNSSLEELKLLVSYLEDML